MKLIKSQELVVDQLVEKTKVSLDQNTKTSVYFKAPTGSGKTFMMINYIDKLIDHSKYDQSQKLIFVIATLSNAELPQQMEENFIEYRHYINNKDLQIQRIESPSNTKTSSKIEKNFKFYAEQNHVYIMGGASFKANSILREEEAIESFLSEIKHKNYKLIYIRDEAHIGSDVEKTASKGKNEIASFETNMQTNAHFVLKMTATPNNDNEVVELTEKELNNDQIKLLKPIKKYNDDLESAELLDNQTILRTACAKFKRIKELYNNPQEEPGLVGINAAMLIQVENSSTKDKEKQKKFDENIDLIIKVLEENNLNWVKYFDQNDKSSNLRLKENYSLRDISKNTSTVDVIIFKIGPATGWNIPRACMLVQLRDVSSNNLSIQTLGRIKRNPNPGFDFGFNSVALNYYIYSNQDIKDNSQKRLILKNEFKDQVFSFGKLQNVNSSTIFNKEHYQTQAFEFIDKLDVDDFVKQNKAIEKEFVKNNFVVAEKKKYGSQEIVAQKLENKIEMEIYNLNFLQNNKKAIYKEIKDKIQNFYNKNLVSKIDPTVFWYIFIKNKMFYLLDLYKNELQKQLENNDIQYKLEKAKALPNTIFEQVGEKSKNVNEKYAYEEPSSSKTSPLSLDSDAEEKFVDVLLNMSEYNPDIQQNLTIWTKNPSYSGINFEYVRNSFEIANSYPDFLIKYKDHYLYIEVKKYKNDIDAAKTLDLFKGYSQYIKNNQNSKTKLSLLIALVGQANNEIYFAGASTIESLNTKLQNRNPEAKDIHEQIKTKESLSLMQIIMAN